jgi:hypothetical protein
LPQIPRTPIKGKENQQAKGEMEERVDEKRDKSQTSNNIRINNYNSTIFALEAMTLLVRF